MIHHSVLHSIRYHGLQLAMVGYLTLATAGCALELRGFNDTKDDSPVVGVAAGPRQSHARTVSNPAPNAEQSAPDAAQSGMATTPNAEARPEFRGNNRPFVHRVPDVTRWGELPGSSAQSQADGSGNLRQVSFTREGADFDPVVAPNGQFIAFASTQHRPTADIYLKQIDGQTVTQITTDPANDMTPTFSPDGRNLAFASDRAGNWDIYIIDLEGRQAVQITNDPADELHPSFSPDGRQLVFCSRSIQSGSWEMVVVDVENPARRKTIGPGLFPEFSPDGTKIVFQKPRYRGTRWFSVWTVDYANGEATRPTEIAASSNAAVINPSFSPEGDRLAFATIVDPAGAAEVQGNARTPATLWVIDLDGNNRLRVTSDGHTNLQPAWGRDGVLYFVSNRSGVDNIWALTPAASPARLSTGLTEAGDARQAQP